jgi:hypothetical protein
MNKFLAVFTLWALPAIAILVPQSVLAQWPPPGDDVLGMYYGDDHDNRYELGFAQSDPVSVILTNVSGASVGGFEFVLLFDISVMVMTDMGLTNAVNYAPENSGQYLVAFTSPPPISTGHATLCEPAFFCFTDDPVYFFVVPLDNPTIPEAIIYNEFDNISLVHEMTPVSGSFEDPIFVFNPEFPIPEENRTWSELKSLFH